MVSRAYQAGDIQGLTPAVDARKSDKLFALGGKNWAFTSLGPASVFGNRFLTTTPLTSPTHSQGLRVKVFNGTRTFIFPGDSVLEWDEENLTWIEHLPTDLTNLSPYRWTYGYLNGKIYFCHPVTGILVYDLENETLIPHDGPGVSITPLAITVNMGRLVVIDDIYLSWSWQSDGMNFTPAIGEAGFQKINDRVGGFPIMVSNYGQGVITWTTGGMMRSEFTGDQEVYRHRNLNTEFSPVNSFCVLQTDENTAVILDERGLFQSQGDSPTPFAPIFNEFLIEYIRLNKLTIGQNLRIEWDDLRRLLYVMISITPEFPQYEKAFVLYPQLDKWGFFDEVHYGIIPIHIDANLREGHYFGFVDIDGRVKFWDNIPSREEMVAGIPTIVGLDAKIQMGLIRFPELQDSHDRMAEVTQLSIGNTVSGPEIQFSEDYLQVPDGVSDEDYQTATGSEDFGLGALEYVNHKTRIIGTLDGRSSFVTEEPTLTYYTEAARHFSCSVPGIYHIIEIAAEDVGEAFLLRNLELNAVDGGRIS